MRKNPHEPPSSKSRNPSVEREQRIAQQERSETLAEAAAYLRLYEMETSVSRPRRLDEVRKGIERAGTYRHTFEELQYGAKVAWRNTPRCIGKFYWRSLQVRDMRHLSAAEQVFEALVDHLRIATNGGKIRLMVTVFAPQEPGRPGIRVWNPQLVRYAGYLQPDGSVLGDPANADLTTAICALGWQGGEGTPFDILPLVIQMPDEPPRVFELPRDAVLEVPITHPEYPWFSDLGLRWYAHPAISNQRLEIGGLSYTLAPFSGWYTSAEIGARNLSDTNRYDMLLAIARRMGLSTRSDRTFWKDRALLELNVAVMHSFTASKVSMIDHHYAARQFVKHEERETLAGRATPADWKMMVAPISGSTSPVFHRSYEETILKPNFFDQSAAWRSHAGSVASGCPVHDRGDPT